MTQQKTFVFADYKELDEIIHADPLPQFLCTTNEDADLLNERIQRARFVPRSRSENTDVSFTGTCTAPPSPRDSSTFVWAT